MADSTSSNGWKYLEDEDEITEFTATQREWIDQLLVSPKLEASKCAVFTKQLAKGAPKHSSVAAQTVYTAWMEEAQVEETPRVRKKKLSRNQISSNKS